MLIPGTDHASIATETKVVEMLKEKGIDTGLSRAEFLTHAWDWKEKYGGIIIKQLKRLGCSCDWENDLQWMKVTKQFYLLVKLYEKGYIYKGFRLVNWCPVSNQQLAMKRSSQENGSLWYVIQLKIQPNL